MMRLGKVQRDVVAYLSRCGVEGGHIGPLCLAKEFQGYHLEQVERAVEALQRRHIVRRAGLRYVLVET